MRSVVAVVGEVRGVRSAVACCVALVAACMPPTLVDGGTPSDGGVTPAASDGGIADGGSSGALDAGALGDASIDTNDANDAGDAGASTDASDAGPPPDSGYPPGCHYDCFGSVECTDSGVRVYHHAPVDCRFWTGACPSYTVSCEEGCRDDLNDYPRWTFASQPAQACEENRQRRVGDACASSDDCAYTTARMDGGVVTNTYLACDVDAGTCVEDAEPVVADWLQPCDLGYTDVGDPGWGSYGFVEAVGCSEAVCLINEPMGAGCLAQGCSRACAYDSDCPQGSVCDDLPQWTYDGVSSWSRVCNPGPPNQIGIGLACP